ncbi:hypothetical protein KM043_008282 [Ampulex compressa]|nr:hypothetical protein KM043_008282 [Ampulex compressa]
MSQGTREEHRSFMRAGTFSGIVKQPPPLPPPRIGVILFADNPLPTQRRLTPADKGPAEGSRAFLWPLGTALPENRTLEKRGGAVTGAITRSSKFVHPTVHSSVHLSVRMSARPPVHPFVRSVRVAPTVGWLT